MRSPRSVTLQPMGMPSRILKPAIEFLARVITGRCPAIVASSSTASSSAFELSLASPTPMLSVIFWSRGTAITVSSPSFSFSCVTHLALVALLEPRRGDLGGAHRSMSFPHLWQTRILWSSVVR